MDSESRPYKANSHVFDSICRSSPFRMIRTNYKSLINTVCICDICIYHRLPLHPSFAHSPWNPPGVDSFCTLSVSEGLRGSTPAPWCWLASRSFHKPNSHWPTDRKDHNWLAKALHCFAAVHAMYSWWLCASWPGSCPMSPKRRALGKISTYSYVESDALWSPSISLPNDAKCIFKNNSVSSWYWTAACRSNSSSAWWPQYPHKNPCNKQQCSWLCHFS